MDPDRIIKKSKFKSVCDDLEKKFLEFPMWKKVASISLFTLIALALSYQIYQVETAVEITTISYAKQGIPLCEDVYVDGVLNSTTCTGLNANIERFNPYAFEDNDQSEEYKEYISTLDMNDFNITLT